MFFWGNLKSYDFESDTLTMDSAALNIGRRRYAVVLVRESSKL